MEVKIIEQVTKGRPPSLFYGSKNNNEVPRLKKCCGPHINYEKNSSLFIKSKVPTFTESQPASRSATGISSEIERSPEGDHEAALSSIHETIKISLPVGIPSLNSISTNDSDCSVLSQSPKVKESVTLALSSRVNESNNSARSLLPIANNSLKLDKRYLIKTSTCCNNTFKSGESNSSLPSKLKPLNLSQSTELQCKSKQKTISSYFNRTPSPAKKKCLSSPTADSKNLNYSARSFHQILLKPCKKENNQITFTPFDLQLSPGEKRKSLSKKLTPKKCTAYSSGKEQTYIDLGQKDFGHVTCIICGMVYTKSQVDDETQHAKYHEKLVQKLKFPGWKNERVVQEFYDGRIILVKSSDNHLHQKKLLDIKEIVDTELGFTKSQNTHSKSDQQVYLFISAKKIVGCAVAVSINKAFPIILSKEIPSSESVCGAPTTSWCCSMEPVSAVCGISRIWVFSQNRRQNIATRIVDCIRQNFLYGCVISKNKIAFSDPTPDGRIFAEKYTEDPRILVFR